MPNDPLSTLHFVRAATPKWLERDGRGNLGHNKVNKLGKRSKKREKGREARIIPGTSSDLVQSGETGGLSGIKFE